MEGCWREAVSTFTFCSTAILSMCPIAACGSRVHWATLSCPVSTRMPQWNRCPPAMSTIVGLKTIRNRLLADLLPASTRNGGIVLVLQNGLDVEADTAAVVGVDRVLGGCCFLCSNKIGPGHIRHLDYGRIVFGEYASGQRTVTPRVQRICDELVSAGIDAQATDDLRLTRWRKLLWNIPFNGLSVSLDASTKDLIDDPDSLALVDAVIREVHSAAAACGVEIPEEMIEKTIEVTKSMGRL